MIVKSTAMGTGRSKKEAKHSAAKALLDKLTGAAPADQSTNGNVPETYVLLTFHKLNIQFFRLLINNYL